jgi:uncharacterized membrane protein affecting hemolysin expression
MIVDPFTSAQIEILAVTLFCQYSLEIADKPLRKTDLKIKKVILPQLTKDIRIPRTSIYSKLVCFVMEKF